MELSKVHIVICGICGASALWLAAPETAAASGYEFDGVGARAAARGGAVIADSDDWTAIYWNPANIASVKRKEAGLELRAGTMNNKDGNSLKSSVPGDAFTKERSYPAFIYGSAGAVMPLNDRSGFGMGVYIPLMQGTTFKDHDVLGMYDSYRTKGYAAIGTANVSYAYRITDAVSAGAGVDALYARLESESHAMMSALAGGGAVDGNLDGEGYGLEGVFGLKYACSDRVTLGAVYRTGSYFRLKGDASITSTNPGITNEDSDFSMAFHHPATSGVGAAWKFSKRLTLSSDFTQTWWHKFSNSTTYDPSGPVLTSVGNTYKWKDSYKVRFGARYAYDPKTDLMFGYAFDTPAIDKGSIDFSTAVDVPMHRLSAAVSHTWSPIETTIGVLAGRGARRVASVNYSVTGWSLLAEARYTF